MTIKKNDFIELSFTGKITNSGEIFDTNIKEDAKSAKFKSDNIKPLILPVGQAMLPKGLDEDLVGKDIEKNYEIDLKPEQAFGKRNPRLIKMIPSKYLYEQKINPVKGMQIALDGKIVKVLSSDRGRTLVDFNNPLMGKTVTYNYRINRIITEQREKITALQEFLFRQIFDFEIATNTIIFSVPKEYEQFVKMFSSKFEEIIGLKIDVKKKKEEQK